MSLLRPLTCLLVLCAMGGVAAAESPPIALAIHGGAGTMARADLDADTEAAIRAALDAALDAGGTVLREGGSALDATVAAVVVLEDSPHFNAGRGAVFTADGVNELDAALMDGATLRAGAVAGLRRVRNPILLARAVMEKSPHVMLIGDGAERFAEHAGLALVDPAYFRTEHRWKQLEEARAREAASAALPANAYFGTVGAVALDRHGHVAAATSTVPVIGAGTYADDGCAVSATGWGEFFIRLSVAHDICARMRYRGDSLKTASDEVVLRRVVELGGNGGVIAIDRHGNIALPFNTSGMYRGWLRTDGSRGTAVFVEP